MSIDLTALLHALGERGVDLAPPVDAAGWQRFGEALPIMPGADF